MPFLKIVKRLRQNEYSSLEEKFISKRIINILFPALGNIHNLGLNIYINKDLVNCSDISDASNISHDINAIKERNKLYINSLIDTHTNLNQVNTPTSKYVIELDKDYCHDKVDLQQIEDIIKRYNELQNCSDVDSEDIKLVLIDN